MPPRVDGSVSAVSDAANGRACSSSTSTTGRRRGHRPALDGALRGSCRRLRHPCPHGRAPRPRRPARRETRNGVRITRVPSTAFERSRLGLRAPQLRHLRRKRARRRYRRSAPRHRPLHDRSADGRGHRSGSGQAVRRAAARHLAGRLPRDRDQGRTPRLAPARRHSAPAGWLYLTRADRVVAIGDTMRLRLEEKGAPRERIRVIPNWVDTNETSPRPATTNGQSSTGSSERSSSCTRGTSATHRTSTCWSGRRPPARPRRPEDRHRRLRRPTRGDRRAGGAAGRRGPCEIPAVPAARGAALVAPPPTSTSSASYRAWVRGAEPPVRDHGDGKAGDRGGRGRERRPSWSSGSAAAWSFRRGGRSSPQ